jgi:TatD DNase family protein
MGAKMIFETHAHYDDEAFDEDREALLHSLPQNNIEFVVNVGASIGTSANTLELVKKYSFMYGAVGVHPGETAELNEENFEWLKNAAKQPKIVALGEIGLDYYWDTPERKIQKLWFDRQMELAKELKLPTIIHSRDAAQDTLEMIKAADLKKTGGVIHCFSYGKDMAKLYLDMGFYLGIGGVVTFKNAKKLKEVVEYTPMEHILLETDCPYLSPEPNRGKRNSSLNLTYVAKEIAGIKGMEYEEVLEITLQNAKKMYRIN